MRDLTEQEIKTLNIIALNEPVTKSTLTRNLHYHGITGSVRDMAIEELIAFGLVKKHQPAFLIRRGGRKPTTYEATHGGHRYLEDYIEQQNSLGAA